MTAPRTSESGARPVASAASICRTINEQTQGKTTKITEVLQELVKLRLSDVRESQLPPNFIPALDKPFTGNLTVTQRDAVSDALDALRLYSRAAYLVEHNDATFGKMMEQVWKDGVWQWMLFFYNGGVSLNDTISGEIKVPTATRQMSTAILTDIICGCVDSTRMGKRLAASSPIVTMVGKLWAEDLEIPNAPPHLVHSQLTKGIFQIINDDPAPRKDPKSAFNVLLASLDKGANTLMDLATKHLACLVKAKPIVADDVKQQVSFINSLTKDMPVMVNELHVVGTISVAIKVVRALSSKNIEQKKTPAHKAAELCIGFLLLGHLLSGPNVSPLTQAIKDGLLKALYDARVVFAAHKGCCSAIGDIMINVIGPSLAFRSVLHAVEHVENKTKILALGAREFEDFDELYEEFQNTIFERDEIDEWEAGMRCARKTCPTRSANPLPKLQRCGRCQYRRYCSRECQRADWNDHKTCCKPEGSELTGDINPISDRDFARNLAELNARMRMDSILERIQANPTLRNYQGDWLLDVHLTAIGDKKISIGMLPYEKKLPNSKRMVQVWASVKNGREVVKTLGAVTMWDEFVEISQGVWVQADPSEIKPTKSKIRAMKSAMIK